MTVNAPLLPVTLTPKYRVELSWSNLALLTLPASTKWDMECYEIATDFHACHPPEVRRRSYSAFMPSRNCVLLTPDGAETVMTKN